MFRRRKNWKKKKINTNACQWHKFILQIPDQMASTRFKCGLLNDLAVFCDLRFKIFEYASGECLATYYFSLSSISQCFIQQRPFLRYIINYEEEHKTLKLFNLIENGSFGEIKSIYINKRWQKRHFDTVY